MDSVYKSILDSLRQAKDNPLTLNQSVLIIDGMNMFIRCFSMSNDINSNGIPIGGMIGFLRAAGFSIRTLQPTRVIIVFDGIGSTNNKKNLYPLYKANRHIKRITNWDTYANQQEESESILNQLSRLVHYLQCLPITLLSIDKIEADDVIGYLSSKFDTVTIISTDKDFLQLASDRITIYSPIKKKFYKPDHVKAEYNVWPQNFLNYKILLGDDGDNVPGVFGLGKKKIFKCYPELLEEKKINLEKLLILSEQRIKEPKATLLYRRVMDFKSQLEINVKLMNLSEPIIPDPDLRMINNIIDNPPMELNKSKFIKMYNEDLLEDKFPNVLDWISRTFTYLTQYKK